MATDTTYSIDPLISWCPTAIRAYDDARALYVNFYPQGLFRVECRLETRLARTFLTTSYQQYRSSLPLQAYIRVAVPITRDPYLTPLNVVLPELEDVPETEVWWEFPWG